MTTKIGYPCRAERHARDLRWIGFTAGCAGAGDVCCGRRRGLYSAETPPTAVPRKSDVRLARSQKRIGLRSIIGTRDPNAACAAPRPAPAAVDDGSVSDATGRRESLPPEAAGVLPGARRQAAPHGQRFAHRARLAIPIRGVARAADDCPTRHVHSMTPAHISAVLAVEVTSPRTPADSR